MIHRLFTEKSVPMAVAALGIALFAGSAACAQTSAPDSPPTAKKGGPAAEKLFEKAMDAMGGMKAFEAMKSMHVEAELSAMMLPEPMVIVLDHADGDRWLLNQQMPGGMGEIKAGSDGKVAWMHHPMAGYQLLEGPMKEQMAEQTRIVRHDLLSQIKEEATELETYGASTFGDEEAWEVHMTDKDGEKSKLYFSQDNGRILGVKSTSDSQMGPVDITITFGEWKEFGPFTLYTKMDMEQGGQQMSVAFKKIEIDKVQDSAFELPQEVKDMSKPATQPGSQPSTVPGG